MKRMLGVVIALAACAHCGAALPTAQYKVVTASERGTYIQIGRDLGRFVAPDADIVLEALPSAGSAENVRRLRFEPGVKLALVQSDVYQAFLDQAAGGNAEAANMIRPLRVVMPLYSEEIYFIARADSPLEYVHEIENMRINVGPIGSGTALTTTTLYRAMFSAPIPDDKASFLSNEDALVKLITDRSLDVVAVIAGQPAKLLTDMKPESRQYIKLLKFDPAHPTSPAALGTYFPATARASSYPNLLAADVPTLSVKAYLVTYDFSLPATEYYLRRFARSLCRNFGNLQKAGHPKWREVDLALPTLGRGWSYYGPVEKELRSCARSTGLDRPARACSQQERVLGLCG